MSTNTEGAALPLASEALLMAGAMLSNIAFNLSQHPGRALTQRECDAMKQCQRDWDAARAALSPAPAAAPVVPPGYALVPVEPTPEMRMAFHAVVDTVELGAAGSRWAAMLAAAPPARQALTEEQHPTRADMEAALKFYANREHFVLSDANAWDTVSGEPPNWWCDEAGTATVEDGSVAAMTLRGELTAQQIEELEDGDDLETAPAAQDGGAA